MNTRVLRDALGEMAAPEGSYWGPQTERARSNFAQTGFVFPVEFIYAITQIKRAAAIANHELNRLPKSLAKAIVSACDEILEGKWDTQFVVDLFQTGSGTSTHMNVNEVVAARGNEIMASSGERANEPMIHANDHVNLGQSSNDAIPSAIHIALLGEVEENLLPELKALKALLVDRAEKWDAYLKPGRTHLQDATPVRIGQVFSGYAHLVKEGINRIEGAKESLRAVALGGTAVGTGINTHPRFAELTLRHLSKRLGRHFYETESHFSAQSTIDPVQNLAAVLSTLVTALMKMVNDIRWLSSGPRTGLGEFTLPELQPGSSIMPGKVNPVILESFLQMGCQVLGCCHTVSAAGQRSEFELNVFLPITLYNSWTALRLLALGTQRFRLFALEGLSPNREHCHRQAMKSLANATPLARRFGYDQVAIWVKKAMAQDRSVFDLVLDDHPELEKERDLWLDPHTLTEPQ